mmetsp:Transcript_57190/g.95016  ORF Transcript_57190/g.95016 Transcript_57190/m.95016 type:complete len:230 (+) Transcript_57190:97-786(+)
MLALRSVCAFAILYGVYGQTTTTAPDTTPVATSNGTCCACTELPETGGQRGGQQQNGCPADLACQDFLCAEVNNQCCGRRWGPQCTAAASAQCAASAPDYKTCCGCLETDNFGACLFDEACSTLVCDHDAFCCTNEWDTVCVSQANAVCFDLEPPQCCGCSVQSNDIGCAVDPECEAMICSADSFCCGFDENGEAVTANNVRWDGQCAQSALDICTGATTTTTSQPLLE